MYASYGLAVLWIEPIPEAFETLCENLRGFERQRALECLITDIDGAEYGFTWPTMTVYPRRFSTKLHREVWPNVSFTKTIALRSCTLTSLLMNEGIDPASYDALVMDTQGSELLVLRGAEALLWNFRHIKTEVADFEAYAGGAQLQDIDVFLTSRGFRELLRQPFANRAAGETYYDVLYASTRI